MAPHQGKTVNFVEHPHPEWQPGDPQPHGFGSDKYVDLVPEEIGSDIYPAIISSICPRPIGFVCCLNNKGQRNLSPYSYFNAMHHDPPLVVLGTCQSAMRGGNRKDMEQYVRETGEFTVNMISNWFIESANFTSGSFDPGVDEVDMSGLTPMPSVRVKAPRIKESALQLECKLKHIYDTTNAKGETTGAIIIAEIVLMHVHEGIAGKSPSGKTIVDIDKYEPIARLGGNYYGRIKEVFELSRPNDAQMHKRAEQLRTQASTGAVVKHSKSVPETSADKHAPHKHDSKKEDVLFLPHTSKDRPYLPNNAESHIASGHAFGTHVEKSSSDTEGDEGTPTSEPSSDDSGP